MNKPDYFLPAKKISKGLIAAIPIEYRKSVYERYNGHMSVIRNTRSF